MNQSCGRMKLITLNYAYEEDLLFGTSEGWECSQPTPCSINSFNLYIIMVLVSNNPIETAKSMKAGDQAIVEFRDFSKFRSFTVQLSDYNMIYGRKRNIYIHAASKKRKLQYYLVATTAEEREAEMADYNLKGLWKKQIPEEWLRA